MIRAYNRPRLKSIEQKKATVKTIFHLAPSRMRFVRLAMLFGIAGLLLLPGANSSEAKCARKTVRVAYQEFNRQMIVDEDNKPVSGYTYDYIQTIATYAGWDVDYVPAASFADSVKLLLASKADLTYEISYTEERAKAILFPDEPM